MIAWPGGRVGRGQARCLARLTPKLDSLRLTTRGKARRRRVGSSRSAISPVIRASVLAGGSGGKGGLAGGGDLAADDSQGPGERPPIWVDVDRQGGLVQQAADGLVDQQYAPELLGDHVGGARAQHHLGAALVGLELVQGGLNLPTTMHS